MRDSSGARCDGCKMRFFSILTAMIVTVALYFWVMERDLLFALASADAEPTAEAAEPSTPARARAVSVVAIHSRAQEVEQAVLARGQTEASRAVDVRAETSGRVVSEPLRKGAFVEKDALLCRIDSGTREVALEDALARLSEAKARVPAAEAALAEAESRVPAAQSALDEAQARVPAAEAALSEAEARVPAAEAALRQAEAQLPLVEALRAEAEARLVEARKNYENAVKLFEQGFVAETRVNSARAAFESAQAGVEQVKSQFEAARAGVEQARANLAAAKAAVEQARANLAGARAAVASARSQLEGAEAAVQSARAQVESARAAIETAEAQVASARTELERIEIRAPFAGLLETDTAELGTLLQPGGLCATILQLDPIKLVGFVPETRVDEIATGARAAARLSTGREVVGRVSFLARSADPATRTFRVEVEAANPDLAIRDGQTAEIIIASAARTAHFLPQSALTLDDEGRLGVRTVEPGGIAGFAPVEIIRDARDGVWVAGLPDEADVIVVGQQYVTEGEAVDVTWREARQ
jgi:multidrug efflux system membrane fusion protein